MEQFLHRLSQTSLGTVTHSRNSGMSATEQHALQERRAVGRISLCWQSVHAESSCCSEAAWHSLAAVSLNSFVAETHLQCSHNHVQTQHESELPLGDVPLQGGHTCKAGGWEESVPGSSHLGEPRPSHCRHHALDWRAGQSLQVGAALSTHCTPEFDASSMCSVQQPDRALQRSSLCLDTPVPVAVMPAHMRPHIDLVILPGLATYFPWPDKVVWLTAWCGCRKDFADLEPGPEPTRRQTLPEQEAAAHPTSG